MNEQTNTVSCPSCGTVYRVAVGAIDERGRVLKCSICQHRFAARLKPSAGEASGGNAEDYPFGVAAPDIAERDAPAGTDTPFETAAPSASFPGETGPYEAFETMDLGDDESTEFAVELGAGDDYDEAAYDAVDTSDLSIGEDDDSDEPVGIPAEEAYSPESRDQEPVVSMVEVEEEEAESEIEDLAAEPVIQTAESEPDTAESAAPLLPVEMYEEPEPELEKQAPPKRWRDPSKAGAHRSLFSSELEAEPSSGMLYFAALILIGLGGFTTLFADPAWRFDPLWSAALLVIGAFGMFTRNLGALYLAGLFSLIHTIGLFSSQGGGEYGGIMQLAVLLALALISLTIYYVLTKRTRGHAILKEGKALSFSALVFGVLAAIAALLGHIDSTTIPPLGALTPFGQPLSEITFYSGAGMAMIIQSALAALAVALGLAARRARNRRLFLAAIGAVLGALVIILLYAPMFLGPVLIPLPL